MRMTKMFSRTLREAPSEVESESQKLLIRAGFIRSVSPGIYSYLPLAIRTIDKIKKIICREMNNLDGQEILLPLVHPAEMWMDLFYSEDSSPQSGRFLANNHHEMILSSAQLEILSMLAQTEISSYKQLPQLLYQFQTKWRDHHHSRSGFLSAREMITSDSYFITIDERSLENQYATLCEALRKIFQICKLPVAITSTASRSPGYQNSQDFFFRSPIGNHSFTICDHCGYSAASQIARTRKIAYSDPEQLPLEKVATPDSKTITDLSEFLQIPKYKTAKAVFVNALLRVGKETSNRFVFVIVRGDMEVSEVKLSNLLNASRIIPASEQEIRDVGAIPGYASPVGLKGVLVVVDDIIPQSSNLVSGANLEGYHFRNVNYGRDYSADIIGDITFAQEGDSCHECGEHLHFTNGVRVGKAIKVGMRMSDTLGGSFLNHAGKTQPTASGFSEIEISRMLACIAEVHHDKFGLCWPINVSPFQLHIVSLPWKSDDPDDHSDWADKLYHQHVNAGIECLFDDREESPGVKFTDADLIGNPLRITISERSIKNGGVEFKRRDHPEKLIIPFDNIIPTIQDEIRQLENMH